LVLIIGHSISVLALQLAGDDLFSASYDKTIIHWSIQSGKLLKQFIGHLDQVRELHLLGEFLFSGSGDNTIRKWKISNGETVLVFPTEGYVYSITDYNDLLYCADRFNTYTTYDFNNGTKYLNIKGGS
jgi:WD40 repeat protein